MGCTATFSAHNNMNDCPDLAVFSGLLGGHLSSLGDDGLGGELRRVGGELHGQMGITLPRPGGMTRLDPVRRRKVRSWRAGRMSRWAR